MTAASVSVVICAYTERRWSQLLTAVDSAAAQPEAAEVVVVVDHNDLLLHRLRHERPAVIAVANEQRQGLSGARNTGVLLASRPVVAFLDDDAQAATDWLRQLVAPLADPAVLGVGGRAEPLWPTSGPAWLLPNELLWIVGCTFTGQPTTLAEVRNVMGCSMAFRRTALETVGGFDVDTGRVGTIPLGGEETDLCIRIRNQVPGAKIMFQPRSVVLHSVSADRLGWRYLLRRSFFEGVSKAALARKLGEQSALSTERAYTRSVLPGGVVRELGSLRVRGVLRAAAIIAALGATAFGYAYGRSRTARASSEPMTVPALDTAA